MRVAEGKERGVAARGFSHDRTLELEERREEEDSWGRADIISGEETLEASFPPYSSHTPTSDDTRVAS